VGTLSKKFKKIGDSNTQGQKLTKAACLQKILKLMPGKAKKKGAKGGKRTRKARIKERRQFSMRD
jgi:hypothetical protein